MAEKKALSIMSVTIDPYVSKPGILITFELHFHSIIQPAFNIQNLFPDNKRNHLILHI